MAVIEQSFEHLPSTAVFGIHSGFYSHLSSLDTTTSHLVDEGGKLVVEGLDLLALLSPHPLDGGVDLQVERGEEALVDGDLLDASRGAHGETSTPIATTKTSSTTEAKATAGSSSKAEASSNSAAIASTNATAAPSDGDPLGAPHTIEASAAKASSSTHSPRATATPGAAHRHTAEARAVQPRQSG